MRTYPDANIIDLVHSHPQRPDGNVYIGPSIADNNLIRGGGNNPGYQSGVIVTHEFDVIQYNSIPAQRFSNGQILNNTQDGIPRTTIFDGSFVGPPAPGQPGSIVPPLYPNQTSNNNLRSVYAK